MPDPAAETTYIEDELKSSYLDYAMSVIVGRALPDARDGLKPVHRRILFAMHEAGWRHDRPFVKSAKVVGEVIANFHPHGDAAVYDTLVRLAQPWSLREVLVEGQGNFGSVDGDPPAAYRYTEARLAPIAQELLEDLDKDTVDFVPNFDGTRKEPTVLPARLPNLLVNGSAGIAVGMATNCPPHNLAEVCAAIRLVLDNPDATAEEILEVLPGPDFPTGGIVHGRRGIVEAAKTGRGRIVLGSRIHEEEVRGRTALVVTEIPYQTAKAAIIEEIARGVEAGKIEGVHDIRDESDREGLRIVVELKRDADPVVVRNLLEKNTNLVTTYGIIFLALVENRPRLLSLPEIVRVYIEHRREVIRRRSRFLLQKAEAEAHIKEGLLKAIAEIDEVIRIIRKSKNRDEAHKALVARFGFSDPQAKAILEMRLHRLTSLERVEEEKALAALLAEIERLKFILATPPEIDNLIREDLEALAAKYGTPRRTEIRAEEYGEFEAEDLIHKEEAVVEITHKGFVKRLPPSAFRAQRRGGAGVAGVKAAGEDFVEHLVTATTHDWLLFFTTAGRCHWRKVHEIPEAGRTARGRHLASLLSLAEGERVAAFCAVDRFDDRFVFFATTKGTVKKTPLADFARPRAGGIHAIRLAEGDGLIDVRLTSGSDELVLLTRAGMALRFPEADVRPMGRTAAGVRGIRLKNAGDAVVALAVVREGEDLLTVTARGFGKRTAFSEYPARHRGGQGVIDLRVTEKTGPVVGARSVAEGDELFLASARGAVIRIPVREVRTIGRATQGVRLMRLEEGDEVVDLAVLRAEGAEGTGF
ncbi:MAG: DNA gyrase subunit A [Actinomycetota bacterium]|nr:MAG: DNA gyrase subunit A [Actinomycetota bacterium]